MLGVAIPTIGIILPFQKLRYDDSLKKISL